MENIKQNFEGVKERVNVSNAPLDMWRMKGMYMASANVIFGEANTFGLVKSKNNLNRLGQTLERAAGVVDKVYRADNYREILAGKANVYLVMPSTSRVNLLAGEFAERLRADFGGEIVAEHYYARALARLPAKQRPGYLRKMEDPSKFKVFVKGLPERLHGKHVVLVDDIYTSGESVDGMREALAGQGGEVDVVVVLSALQGGRAVKRPTLEAIARKLGKALNESPKQILSDLLIGHGHSSDKLMKNLEKDLRGGKNARAIRDIIGRKAETLRTVLGRRTGGV